MSAARRKDPARRPRRHAADRERGGSSGIHVILIVVATLLALSPLTIADFTSLDDESTVARNPKLNPPTGEGLRYHWAHPHMDLYVPVTYTAWWVLANLAWMSEPDATGIQFNPFVFHTANLLTHIAAALVAYALLVRLLAISSAREEDSTGRLAAHRGKAGASTRTAAAACAGALLFALHPVQVKTVGWVSGLKDLLFGLLSLVALWQYVIHGQVLSSGDAEDAAAHDSAETGRVRSLALRHYAFASVALMLAMLSKPTAVVVPAIALVLDFLILRRPGRPVLRSAL